MGFRQGGYMTVWSTEPSRLGNSTKVRLSSSRKNKVTGEYEPDFSDFCTFIGSAHEAAAGLKEKDRIKIIECDVSTTYDKEKNIKYVNCKVFKFEMANGASSTTTPPIGNGTTNTKKKAAIAEEGEIEEDNLPF